MSDTSYIRRIWNFSKALDLALVDEEVEKGLNLKIGLHHGERVGYISLRLGLALGMNEEELRRLLIAGLLHDIGAVGGFTKFHGNPYWMKEHTFLGAEIIRNFPDGEALAEILLHHHEAPKLAHSVLKADPSQVSLMAKVVALADKLDVNISRKALSRAEREKVIDFVKHQEGNLIYGEVIPAFLKLAETEAFWLDLEGGDLLEITLDRLYHPWELEKIEEDVTKLLATTFAELIDRKSTFTARHSVSVANTVKALAEGLGWQGEKLRDIEIAGLLHDLGKMSVPRKILDKPGPLDPPEVDIIRTHTYHTYHLLKGAGFPQHVIEWAAFHHERLDGKGYPFGITADKLDTGSRLMTIADIFVALTEERPYRKALTPEKAMEIITRGVGVSVDQELVDHAREVLL